MWIRLMSDYGWQLKCLESRLQHPEWYAEDENVPETIAKIIKYLARNKEVGKAEGLYQKFLALAGTQAVRAALESDTEEGIMVQVMKRREKKPCSRVIYIELE